LLYFKQIEVTGSEEDYRRLSLAYARAALQTNEALLKKMNGEAVTPPPVKLPNQLTKAKIPLYSLFEYWRDLVPNRSKRTVEDVERRINQFDALTKHKSAELLTKADAIAYRDQLIAKGKATRTVAKDLSYIKAVLQAAADADKIPSNPAALIKVPKAKGASGPKRILNNDDLTVLFGSDIYTKNKRPTGGGGEAAAWVPLIALYTGARLEEICQLTVDDVKTEAKIPHFRIQLIDEGNAGVQKVLKTEGSQRDVPIHQGLIKAGLLKYVDHLRKQKQIWLFPDLKPDTYGRRGGNFTKWWSRWRDSLDVGGTHRCFHAFRHTFKTACRHAAIGEDFHDAITGHAGGGEGRGYGHFPLEALNAQLQDVAYPELHFLWSWSAT
jgi:integrase